jgi:hypothetical protein
MKKMQTFRKVSCLSLISLLAVSVAHAQSITVLNNSFQLQPQTPGQTTVLTPNGPTGWTGFNVGSGGNYDIGLSGENGSDFTAGPLAAPASGNSYLWINRFNGNGTQVAGVYQDVGSLMADTQYTLTVAIGQRAGTGPNGSWSPGIISLLNGTDNTGALLATGGGLPSTPNTWQDYTASFTTGALVNGDLTIDLSVLDAPSIQADFSNVELTATPVPESGTCGVVSAGLALLSAMGVRRRGGFFAK